MSDSSIIPPGMSVGIPPGVPPENSSKKSVERIVSLIISSVLTISFIIFYFAVWRIPNNSAEVKKIRDLTIENIEKGNAMPKDENAWFLCSEAVQKLEAYRTVHIYKNRTDPCIIGEHGLTKKNREIMKKYIADNGGNEKSTSKYSDEGIDTVFLDSSRKFKRKTYETEED